MDNDTVEGIAAEILGAADARRQIAPATERHPDLDLAAAYRVSAAVRRLRRARGEQPVGRKIGFTNRTIWPEYGVWAPIWGDMFDSTVETAPPEGAVFELARVVEPRIEPEIAFGLARAPAPGMDEPALLSCIEWVAHGIEIVQSLFPGWRFAAADTVAAFALHGAYLLGPRVAVKQDEQADWLARLADFEIALERNGAEAAGGHAPDVLDGPLSALAHLVGLLAEDPVNPPLAAGEIVTTGTVTRALPVASGEHWRSRVTGLPLPGLALRFA